MTFVEMKEYLSEAVGYTFEAMENPFESSDYQSMEKAEAKLELLIHKLEEKGIESVEDLDRFILKPKKIVKTWVITRCNLVDFQTVLEAAINEAQEAGLEAEVQYSPTHQFLSALVLGYKEEI